MRSRMRDQDDEVDIFALLWCETEQKGADCASNVLFFVAANGGYSYAHLDTIMGSGGRVRMIGTGDEIDRLFLATR